MNSYGIFCDVNLKKSNDLMDVFEQAVNKTNNLMETMENFNTHKIQDKNQDEEKDKNTININNEIGMRKLKKFKTYNQKASKKFQLKPIKSSNKYFKVREPFNYQKEYENDLINQIENLFNPNYKNNFKENTGMISFLSPLIDSNIISKNNSLFGSKKKISKIKPYSYINQKIIKNENEKQISINNIKPKRRIGKDFENRERNEKIEIKRAINKTKNDAIKDIYFKVQKNNKSNVDILINKLKKKYS